MVTLTASGFGILRDARRGYLHVLCPKYFSHVGYDVVGVGAGPLLVDMVENAINWHQLGRVCVATEADVTGEEAKVTSSR